MGTFRIRGDTILVERRGASSQENCAAVSWSLSQDSPGLILLTGPMMKSRSEPTAVRLKVTICDRACWPLSVLSRGVWALWSPGLKN